MKHILLASITLMIYSNATMANNPAVTQLLDDYQSQGASIGNAQSGEQLWNKTFSGEAPFTERSCSTCHTDNLKNRGKHARTGKELKPLAPSVNKQSVSDTRKIKKWLKRNCKWTLGRECTAQEKSDILTFINQQ